MSNEASTVNAAPKRLFLKNEAVGGARKKPYQAA